MNKKYLTFISLLIVFCIALIIWRSDSPYPSVMGWDIFAHQSLFFAMQENGWHVLPSEISDTFLVNAYFPVFAIFLGMFQPLSNLVSLPGYFYLLDSLHFLSTIIVSALLAWVVTKDHLTTFLAGVFGAFAYEAVVAQTSLFAIPQNIAATLVILSLIWWLQGHRNRAQIAIFPTMLLHFVIGGFGWIVLAGTWFAQIIEKNLTDKNKSLFWLVIIGILGFVGAIGIDYILTLNPLGTTESMQFTFTLQDKYTYLLRTYSYTWIFFVLGIGFILMKAQKPVYASAAFLALLLVAAVVLPLPYSLKFYTVARYPVHLIMAIGAAHLIYRLKASTLRIGMIILLVATQALVFFYNQNTFKHALAYGTIRTTASTYEWEAAQFLRSTYGDHPSVLLVSDPATQHVLEGLSGINTQGGGFATTATREVVDAAFPLTDATQTYQEFLTLKDVLYEDYPDMVLFAVSGRFMNWQHLEEKFRYDEGYNIWSARDLTPEGQGYANQLAQQDGFKQVFSNPAMVIFEIRR